jgi:hypothetical protein
MQIFEKDVCVGEVIDNFLGEKEFSDIKSILMSPEMGWFHQSDVVSNTDKGALDTYFIHTFFSNFYGWPRGVMSELYPLCASLIEKLDVEVLIRLRANNYPHTPTKVQHGFHVDCNYPHEAAIFYVNTNNGLTILEGGQEIKSIENRVAIFDGKTKHCSTTCTDERARINIVVNYIRRTK